MTKDVIIVEDDDKSMRLIKLLCSKINDLKVLEARNGHEGLKMIQEGNPSLVILDIKLPGIDGIEICQRLRRDEVLSKLPIIAVTAYALNGDEKRILDAGFDMYFPKPLDIKAFTRVVNQFLS